MLTDATIGTARRALPLTTDSIPDSMYNISQAPLGGSPAMAALFPGGLNASALLAMIQSLTPVAKENLFKQLGMDSEDVHQLVGQALGAGAGTAKAAGDDDARLMQYPEYRAHKLLRLYVPPVLLLLGTFGNIFSFLILRHKAMARQSTHHFLAALAVVDSLVLYVGLFRQWLGDLTGFDPQVQSEWLCKTIVTLGYTCSNVSVWIIVAVTVERYIVVCHPLKATLVCNVSRAKRVVLAITALFVLINLHFLWTTSLTGASSYSSSSSSSSSNGGNSSPECNSGEGHEFLITEVWPWVDAVLYGFGPFVIIFVLNVFIIVRVLRATSGRISLQNRCLARSPVRNTCGGNNHHHHHHHHHHHNINNSVNNINNGNAYTLLHQGRSTSDDSVSSNHGSQSSSSSSSHSHNSNSGNHNNCNNNNNNNNNSSKPVTSHHNLSVPAGPPPQTTTSALLCSALIPHSGGVSAGRGGAGAGANRRFATHTNLRLTVMLLVVSITFLLTTLPMNASIIAAAFWNRRSSEDLASKSRFQLGFTVAELLMYLNHSVNFFLYCATGHKFRGEVVRMVCGKQRPNAVLSDHSQHLYCSRNCVGGSGGPSGRTGVVVVGGGGDPAAGGGGGRQEVEETEL